MKRYLFIGGPRDGQWHGVSGLFHVTRVPNLIRGEGVHWRYYRRTVQVPGWLVPLDVYMLDGITEIPRETVLPGFAYGRMAAWQTERYPYEYRAEALRDAVAAFNRERLSR